MKKLFLNSDKHLKDFLKFFLGKISRISIEKRGGGVEENCYVFKGGGEGSYFCYTLLRRGGGGGWQKISKIPLRNLWMSPNLLMNEKRI